MSSKQSLESRTVSGVGWSIATSLGSRALGVIGTIALTYFLAPKVAGDVSVAYVIVLTVHHFTLFGIVNYMVAKPKAGPDFMWHATVLHIGVGMVPIAATYFVAERVAVFLNAPGAALYVPGFILAVLLERVSNVPERVLMRQVRFRPIGIARTLGEITYSVIAVALAALFSHPGVATSLAAFLGPSAVDVGMCIVYGNIARYALFLGMVSAAAERSQWLAPSPLAVAKVREILRFGIPIAISNLTNYAVQRFDKAIVSKLFGPAVVGAFERAYNLADIPAVQIGEQIGDVLLPSLAQMESKQRNEAFVRSTGILALIVFPLAVGLGSIAETLISTLLHPDWWQVAPMLTILAAMGAVRALGWTTQSFLQACDRPRALMIIGLAKAVVLLGSVAALGLLGPYWACVGVGVGFAFYALSGMWIAQRYEGVPILHLLGRCVPPLLSCVPMVAAVLGARWLWTHLGLTFRGVGLVLELSAGAVVYLAAALLIARSTSLDLLALVRDTLRRRRGED